MQQLKSYLNLKLIKFIKYLYNCHFQIGLGMNIDSVNDESIQFNEAISGIAKIIQSYLMNPWKNVNFK